MVWKDGNIVPKGGLNDNKQSPLISSANVFSEFMDFRR